MNTLRKTMSIDDANSINNENVQNEKMDPTAIPVSTALNP